ncbi:MAG: Cyclic-di-AMP phosphodiesterase [Succiniclasticum sp.]|jgi:cyclic-di-AMP phosphodiesterase
MFNKSLFSSWKDVTLYVTIIFLLLAALSVQQPMFLPAAVLIAIAVFWFARRTLVRKRLSMSGYLDDIIRNIDRANHFAVRNLDVGIAVFSSDGKLQWKNEKFQNIVGKSQLDGKRPEEVLPLADNAFETMCVKDDEKILRIKDRWYNMRYFSVQTKPGDRVRDSAVHSSLMVYLMDVTELENLKIKYHDDSLNIAFVRFDNYEDVAKGMSEAARANLTGEVSERVSQWAETLNGFVWRSGKENCMVGFTNVGLKKALEDKFSILDRVREIKLENKLAPTLSIGISGEGATLAEISMNASKALDLALGRGGDQVVVQSGKEMQYFGGTSTVNAKSTRVRVRIVAHTIREQMMAADRVFVMGHENEDYDAIGSAVGVAKMALSLKKPTYIVYSGNSMSFDKVKEYMFDEKDKIKSGDINYLDHLVKEEEALKEITPRSLLMLVDHHRAVLCASRKVLDAIPKNRIIIDHHRRAEDVIPNTILQYMEPSSSSTSELVTELVGYFDEKLEFDPEEATLLYCGLVVDTKNFNVQTGERTFEAAALLRRNGANPLLVRQLFKDDLASYQERYRIIAQAEMPIPHLAISVNNCSEARSSESNIVAAQAADNLINITDISVGVVITDYGNGDLSVSARSDGSINVQVIMEELGGGGHQTVAGVQLHGANVDDVKRQIIELTQQQMDEAKEKSKDESNLTD